MPPRRRLPTGILTVDYEDWFHVSDPHLRDPRAWERLPLSVEKDTATLLDFLDEFGAHATFFAVGWLAERTPDTVREIVRRGHNLGLHGYYHTPPDAMTEAEFRQDLLRCRDTVAEIAGVLPVGYRAPFFGVTRCAFPYLNVLRSCGLLYDCSFFTGICPGRRRARTGRGGRPLGVPSGFREFPVPSVRVLGVPVAFSGGGFLRLFPHWFIRWSSARAAGNGVQVVHYLHPRDLNPEGRVAPTSRVKHLRYYGGRRSLVRKLRVLLSAVRMVSVEECLEGWTPDVRAEGARRPSGVPAVVPAASPGLVEASEGGTIASAK